MPTAPTVTKAWAMMLIALTIEPKELDRHCAQTGKAGGSSSPHAGFQVIQFFGVNAPVAAFMDDSPTLLA